MEWILFGNRYPPEQLSILDTMLSEMDMRTAKQQLDTGYAQYGGWRPMQGFKLSHNLSLLYPGDPPIQPWAITKLRNETICVYPGDWIMILQDNDSFEIARMD